MVVSPVHKYLQDRSIQTTMMSYREKLFNCYEHKLYLFKNCVLTQLVTNLNIYITWPKMYIWLW